MNASERALDLLSAAHETLTNAVTPSAAKQNTYDCLMIANALRIVERHFRTMTEGNNGRCATGVVLNDKAWAEGIRAGLFDMQSPLRSPLVGQLRDQLSRQLAIDNPRALEQLNQPVE